eukprot:COSAG06_NODE_7_length_38054_cov_37.302569_36_plen_42_part_00
MAVRSEHSTQPRIRRSCSAAKCFRVRWSTKSQIVITISIRT